MITSESGRGRHAPPIPYDLVSVAATAIDTAEQRLPDRIINFVLLMTEDAPGQQPGLEAEADTPADIVADLLTAVASSVDDGSVVSLKLQANHMNGLEIAIISHTPSLPPWQKKGSLDGKPAPMDKEMATLKKDLAQAGGRLEVGLTESDGVNLHATLPN